LFFLCFFSFFVYRICFRVHCIQFSFIASVFAFIASEFRLLHLFSRYRQELCVNNKKCKDILKSYFGVLNFKLYKIKKRVSVWSHAWSPLNSFLCPVLLWLTQYLFIHVSGGGCYGSH